MKVNHFFRNERWRLPRSAPSRPVQANAGLDSSVPGEARYLIPPMIVARRR